MALKPDRDVVQTDITYIFNTTAERGGIATAATGAFASGAAMDSANQVAIYANNPSGARAVGVLLGDFVNIDLSRQRLNWHKEEYQVGMKAPILRKGIVVTNMIVTGLQGLPILPAPAYVGISGVFSATQGIGTQLVGEFLTRPDNDGYARVKIDV